jgi:hypothetical protein
LRRFESLHIEPLNKHFDDWLDANEESSARLALCRAPRRDKGFAEDIGAISEYASIDPLVLANCLRAAWGLEALQNTGAKIEGQAQLLAAARSVVEEPVTDQEAPPHRWLRPAWIDDAADLILGHAQDSNTDLRFPRNLELAVVLHLPLAIIELPSLSGDAVVSWLRNSGVELDVHTPPRGLRGALLANGGSGLLFVSADDSQDERRLTVAHEAAHFALDYWMPRRQIAERAPHLLDVIDGKQAITEDVIADGLLARVRLGLQTHLFERDQQGKALDLNLATSEERATFAAWELLAPRESVWAKASSTSAFALVRLLEDEFGLPRNAARDYGDFLTRASADGNDRFSFDDD